MLGLGDTLPELALRDPAGRLVVAADLLARGPLVLGFLRQDWLGACAGLLGRLATAAAAVAALGGSMACVAPQDVHHLAGTVAGRRFGFCLLGDPERRLARLCGIDRRLAPASRRHGPAAAGAWACRDAAGRCVLPLAGTYVIGQDGVVRRAFVDDRHGCHIQPLELMTAVGALVGGGRG